MSGRNAQRNKPRSRRFVTGVQSAGLKKNNLIKRNLSCSGFATQKMLQTKKSKTQSLLFLALKNKNRPWKYASTKAGKLF